MKLIAGLGNPGEKYRTTPHNAGFRAVDALYAKLAPGSWSSRFKGFWVRGDYRGSAFALLKPQTYMNASGESVAACIQFFKIDPEEVLIVADDIDRPVGSLRYRMAGGHGGHNGLRSIIQRCGTDRFHRLKIGIGRPVAGQDVARYVLGQPGTDLGSKVEEAVQASVRYLLDFLEGNPIQIQTAGTEAAGRLEGGGLSGLPTKA